MRAVKEWDLDAYRRKFSESWVAFQKGEQVVFRWVSEVEALNGGAVGFHVLNKAVEAGFEPIYYLFESGYYPMKTGSILALFRGTRKAWKQGLGPHSWNGREVHIKDDSEGEISFAKLPEDIFTAPFDIDRVNKSKVGVINRDIALTLKSVYAHGIKVGIKEGNRILLNEKSLLPYLKSSLGPEWQIF